MNVSGWWWWPSDEHLPKGLAAAKRSVYAQFCQADWKLAPFRYTHRHGVEDEGLTGGRELC